MPLSTAASAPVTGQSGSLTNLTKLACPFLDILPLDIRLMIYRYLLVGHYNKQRLHMRSAEYDENRDLILNRSDYSYRFHTSILGANQKIRREALDVFKRENTFISIMHLFSGYSHYLWNTEYEVCGFATIASDKRARKFPGIGMTVEFNTCYESSDSFRGTRAVSVLLEDLPAACVSLQQNLDSYSSRSQEVNDYGGHTLPPGVNICVTISEHVGEGSMSARDGSPIRGSKLWQCLQPLRHINGASQVEIHGLACPAYTAAIIADMCGKPPEAKETMALVGAQFDEGDKASLKGDLVPAIDRYKATLLTVRRSAFKHDVRNEILLGGRFHGLQAGRARADTEVRLHILIAEAYLRLGAFRLARVYVERIYGPLHSLDDRANKKKFPLQIPQDGAAQAIYAQLLVVAARISLTHGKYHEAMEELHEGFDLDPLNGDIVQLLQHCHTWCSVREQRRRSVEERERKVIGKKFDAVIQMVRDRNRKGDQASDHNNLALARKQYIIAYEKAQNVKRAGYPYYLSVPKDLSLNILSKITTVSLDLHDFESANRWADILLSFLNVFTTFYRKHEMPYAKEAFYTAHYSKAVVYQKQGMISGAIANFEMALLCDNGCAATYYQLEALKQRKELRDSRRRAEEERIRQHRDIIKKVAEKKIRKRKAKQDRRREMKARGYGYVPGVGSF